MKNPLVSITIPTYNSAKTIKKCLIAVNTQTYKNIEVIIIDKNSADKTITLVKKIGVEKITIIEGSLLKARYEGVKLSRGKYTLILDSDQILNRNCLENAVKMAMNNRYKMIALEEDVYKANTFLEKLFELDRKLINAVCNLDPFTGVIMPRFFETKLLKTAYGNIPKSLFKNTGGPDHAIVYYEAWKIDKEIGVLPGAVRHLEPSKLVQLLPKFYRWGYTSLDAHLKKYDSLMSKKERFRTGLFAKGLFWESLGSITLLFLKGVGFKLGYYKAMFDRLVGLKRQF